MFKSLTSIIGILKVIIKYASIIFVIVEILEFAIKKLEGVKLTGTVTEKKLEGGTE